MTCRTCLFLVNLHLCRLYNPLVLFHRKMVSSMSHRFFLPRKCQVSGTWEAAFSAGGGHRSGDQPQPGCLGQCTGLRIKQCSRLSIEKLNKAKYVSPIYLDIQIIRILVRGLYAAKIKMKNTQIQKEH